ncbi:hypothetical protein EKK58_08685 [Candidatus Dependentiae bacterium]|nr:MAG: hypothetical protein EKK58_08685 [Candidatus Dependentiae bacterium]
MYYGTWVNFTLHTSLRDHLIEAKVLARLDQEFDNKHSFTGVHIEEAYLVTGLSENNSKLKLTLTPSVRAALTYLAEQQAPYVRKVTIKDLGE